MLTTHRYRSTDIPCESTFGLLKFIKAQFANMSVESADALAMSKKNHLFSTVAPGLVPRRPQRRVRRKNASTKSHKVKMKEARVGRLDQRDAHVRTAMLTYARRGVGVAKARTKADKTAAAATQMERRKLAIQKKLDDQVKAWIAVEKAFAIHPISGVAELDTQLGLLNEKQQAKCVKEQIVRLVDGCGLRAYKPKKYTSSKDATIGKEGSAANLG